ncbi:hypothetical protein L4X63_15760 [Geomonas sp. Red32]|uniref:hypothetical protein n=1 Tax=Geomonas sp. Red32 TaxID=2912856 RepID=UPI00202CD069|nr:hypothetical protein [Geomonas sp. Red32]MCM0083048.1 hypothetical protein [Geomonas sp. Red32]
MRRDDLQKAISHAAATGLGAVDSKAFEKTAAGTWKIRPKCLSEYYSSGEKVVCGILLVLYWELYGSHQGVKLPETVTWENHPVDLVWPGAYWFLKALDNLTHEGAWSALKTLLPGKG